MGALPEVDFSEFERYQSIGDLRDCPPDLGASPHKRVWIWDNPPYFMGDNVTGVMWKLMGDGSVCMDSGVEVASYLPEFLARVKMENSIWESVCLHDSLGIYPSMMCGDWPLSVPKPAEMWRSLSAYLSAPQLEYLKKYRALVESS